MTGLVRVCYFAVSFYRESFGRFARAPSCDNYEVNIVKWYIVASAHFVCTLMCPKGRISCGIESPTTIAITLSLYTEWRKSNVVICIGCHKAEMKKI